jgi:hypothetical protein
VPVFGPRVNLILKATPEATIPMVMWQKEKLSPTPLI